MVDTQLEEIITNLETVASLTADKIRYINLYHLSNEKEQDLEFLNKALTKILYSKYLLLGLLEKMYNGEIPPFFAILEEVKASLGDILPEIILDINNVEKKIMSKTVDISELKKIAEKDVQEAKKILLQY